MACITLLAAVSIALIAVSCTRPSRASGSQAGNGGEPAGLADHAATPGVASEPSGPVEMQPNGGTPSPAAAKAGSAKTPAQNPRPRVAESLAGHDRHLAYRPFDAVEPSDFELGILAVDHADPAVTAILALIEEGILAGTLPDSLFASDAARVASLFLADGFEAMPKASSVRFAMPQTQPGGTVAVPVRIIVADGPAQRQTLTASALGLVILAPAEEATLLVEHLELDLPSLGETAVRITAWDPYSRLPSP